MELHEELFSLDINIKKRKLSEEAETSVDKIEYPEKPFVETIKNTNLEDNQTPLTKPIIMTNLKRRSFVENEEPQSLRRSTRIKTASTSDSTGEKKTLAPHNDVDIKKIYLNKKFTKHSASLETIFEVPVNRKVMSVKKFRRFCSFEFNACRDRMKTKKRLMKAKQVASSSCRLNKVSIDFLKQKLEEIESD